MLELAWRMALRLWSSSLVQSVRSRWVRARPWESLSLNSPLELGSRPDTRLQPAVR